MKFFLRTTTLMLLLLSRTPALAVPLNQAQSSQSRPQINQACPQAFKLSLSGLYSIPDINSATIRQPIADFENLYSQVPQAQHELEVLCKSIALNTQTQPIFAGIKSQQRAKEKVEKELNGQADRITDLARATIVSQDLPSLVRAYQQLHQQTNVLQVKTALKLQHLLAIEILKSSCKCPIQA